MTEKSNTEPKYKLIIERRFVGEKSAADVILPIILDNIKRKLGSAAHSTEAKPQPTI